MKITEKLLKQRGYTRFYSSIFGQFSDLQYQRRVTDKRGMKYFINLVHYPADVRWGIEEAWMAVMHNNQLHYTFQMHYVVDLDEVEKKMEKFWRALGCEYYESGSIGIRRRAILPKSYTTQIN